MGRQVWWRVGVQDHVVGLPWGNWMPTPTALARGKLAGLFADLVRHLMVHTRSDGLCRRDVIAVGQGRDHLCPVFRARRGEHPVAPRLDEW